MARVVRGRLSSLGSTISNAALGGGGRDIGWVAVVGGWVFCFFWVRVEADSRSAETACVDLDLDLALLNRARVHRRVSGVVVAGEGGFSEGGGGKDGEGVGDDLDRGEVDGDERWMWRSRIRTVVRRVSRM
jgi:hypothetical protein